MSRCCTRGNAREHDADFVIRLGLEWPEIDAGSLRADREQFSESSLEPEADGGYSVVCPAVPGCVSQGHDLPAALSNIREAILLCLEVCRADGLAPVAETPELIAGEIQECLEDRAAEGLPLTIETRQVDVEVEVAAYCNVPASPHVLQRHWHLFDILRAKSEARLPAILSGEEVRGILRCVRTPRNHAFLSTVYACGLRLQEAQYLEVSDIDSQRMMIHVHRGKGAKDRFVPLPRATLTILRAHWRSHRNPRLLFPAGGRDGRSAMSATTPMAKSSVQGAFRHAKRNAGIAKRGVSVHTLRHCYATHLLEAGVNPRVIQRHMGHASLESTMLYLHLTHKGTENAYALIYQVMEGL